MFPSSARNSFSSNVFSALHINPRCSTFKSTYISFQHLYSTVKPIGQIFTFQTLYLSFLEIPCGSFSLLLLIRFFTFSLAENMLLYFTEDILRAVLKVLSAAANISCTSGWDPVALFPPGICSISLVPPM